MENARGGMGKWAEVGEEGREESEAGWEVEEGDSKGR